MRVQVVRKVRGIEKLVIEDRLELYNGDFFKLYKKELPALTQTAFFVYNDIRKNFDMEPVTRR